MKIQKDEAIFNMKLTKQRLKEIIKEEIQDLNEVGELFGFSKTGIKIYTMNIKNIVGELQHLKYSLEKNNPQLFSEVVEGIQDNLKMMVKNLKNKKYRE